MESSKTGRLTSKLRSKFDKFRGTPSKPDPPQEEPGGVIPPAPNVSKPADESSDQVSVAKLSLTDGGVEHAPLSSTFQEHLWNAAYEKLKESDKDVVEWYERILSAELQGGNDNAEAPENNIASSKESRDRQMQRVLQVGLDRTNDVYAAKKSLDKHLKPLKNVKGLIDKAVHCSSEASIVWAGVTLGLEVRIESWIKSVLII